VKADFRSSQLSLAIAIAPAADSPRRATPREDLPEQLARLTEAERTQGNRLKLCVTNGREAESVVIL
jgi:hypothetical protein